jgi:hypothetical protein
VQPNRMPTPLRDAAVLSPAAPLSAPPPIPGTVIVQRRDKKTPQTVLETEIRWALPIPGQDTIHWSLTGGVKAMDRDAPFIRKAPDSRFCVRVDFLERGRAA